MWRGCSKKVFTRIASQNNSPGQKKVNITIFCKLFGISRQGFYQKVKRSVQEKVKEHNIVKMVNGIRKHHKRMGGKKIHFKLQESFEQNNIKCGRDKLFDILRDNNLLVKHRKRFVKTTQSKHLFYKYPNLIKDLTISKAEQVFASDITYIRTEQGFLYLFLITDVYSKQIMGWELANNMKTINAVRALKMAIKNRQYHNRRLIHHSDRGLQYCNPSYIQILNDYNIKISMTTKYDPYENAVAERINGVLKTEYAIDDGFAGEKDAKRGVRFSIKLYNTDRPHLSCNCLTPAEAHVFGRYKLKHWSQKLSLVDQQ